MILGHFLLFIGIQFAKNTFFYYDSANVAGIFAQHRHYAFQPIQGQRWMPAPGQHCWIKVLLTTANFLLLV